MNSPAPTLASLISALAAALGGDYQAELAALPYDALGDDYRANPEKACRKALHLTRSIHLNGRRLRAINRLLGMHGLEVARLRNGTTGFIYCNSGDSYACTVVLFASGTFRVTSWGDIVERSNAYT